MMSHVPLFCEHTTKKTPLHLISHPIKPVHTNPILASKSKRFNAIITHQDLDP